MGTLVVLFLIHPALSIYRRLECSLGRSMAYVVKFRLHGTRVSYFLPLGEIFQRRFLTARPDCSDCSRDMGARHRSAGIFLEAIGYRGHYLIVREGRFLPLESWAPTPKMRLPSLAEAGENVSVSALKLPAASTKMTLESTTASVTALFSTLERDPPSRDMLTTTFLHMFARDQSATAKMAFTMPAVDPELPSSRTRMQLTEALGATP